MKIITRAEWGARPPDAVVYVPWSKRTGFAVHYSGDSARQTVRSIQDYCMDKRGFSDIDYNFLVDYKGNIYEGRGWMNRGSHILDHNTENIGVCAIGTNPEITDAQMHAISELYKEANRRKGGILSRRTHRGVTGKTDCPGDRLAAWVAKGMPDPLPKPTPAFPPYPGKVMKRSTVYNASVKIWQQRMHDRGWNLEVDGLLGPETARVIAKFQKEKGLTVTSTINKWTWDKAWTAPVTK